MKAKVHPWRLFLAGTGVAVLTVLGVVCLAGPGPEVEAAWPWKRKATHAEAPVCVDGEAEWAGQWYWLRSPEQERRVIMNRYKLLCVRCHDTTGRGVWDVPDVPDFTNAAWQASRSEAQLARITLEGRGAVMPAFRGTLTLEEAWAMARYLRTFAVPPASRPDLRQPKDPGDGTGAPTPADPGAEQKNLSTGQ